MLNILLRDSNYYQVLGLSFLIFNQVADDPLETVCFLLPSEERNQDIANIIFHDDMVSIYVFNKVRILRDLEQKTVDRIAIHIPFLTKSQTINDITMKLSKILAIAKSNYNLLDDKEETYWNFGLKKYSQLSDAENNVMILIGQGNNNADISRILNRSQKTISTHYRNASRKMGTTNRAEFYRYAAFIAKCKTEERNTLCL